MHDLKEYGIGGTVHLVVNNQIGFTTYPGDSRTCKHLLSATLQLQTNTIFAYVNHTFFPITIALYCTDIAETVQAPVFHVNADEPELVDAIMRLALDYRQTFHKDVVIDVIGNPT